MFAKSSQLPALVETDKHRLEEARLSLKDEQRKKDKQFTAYYQVGFKNNCQGYYFSFGMSKPKIWVSDQVRHKVPCTTVTEKS